MKESVRETLVETHISAVAIAVLLCWSIEWGFLALKGPVLSAFGWVLNAILILGVPFRSNKFTFSERTLLVTTVSYLFYGLVSFVAAWLLSRWSFGAGPFRSLTKYRAGLTRRIHV